MTSARWSAAALVIVLAVPAAATDLADDLDRRFRGAWAVLDVEVSSP
jgi:hypothetical protein